MIELGLPYIRGYRPRGNYQAALAGEIRRQLRDGRVLGAIQPVRQADPPPAGSLRPGQRPSSEARKRAGRHVDYGLLQEENRRLGVLGERLAFEFEQRRLRAAGRDDLAGRVRWAARDDGDGLGYDVLSFDDAGRERHIEVKTTGLGALTPFYMSSAEVDFARSHPDSYMLFRIYDATTSPCFFALDGDISAAVELVPATYRVQLAAGGRDRGAGPASRLGS
jgi:hypothetical protein